MKKLIIHIGYPKTATTTLQKNLFPMLAEIDNIEWIHGNSYFNKNEGLKHKCEAIISTITSQREVYFNESDCLKEIEGLKKITKKISVISDEDLVFRYHGFSWAYAKDAIQNAKALKEKFSAYFDFIEILITIRAQQTIIPSFFVQCYDLISKEDKKFKDIGCWVRTRFGGKVEESSLFFNYYKLYNTYVNVFGEENVHIVLFEDLLNDKYSFYKKIGDILNIETSIIEKFIKKKSQNITLKGEKGFYSKKNTLFYKTIIAPIRMCIKYISNDYQYDKLKKIYRFFIPSLFREKKVIIRNLEQKEIALIHSTFKESNFKLINKLGLDIKKMKLYKYI